MSLSDRLKLADYSQPLTHSEDALYFERRSAPRRRLRGQVTALLSDPLPHRDYHRICPLQLRDQSDGGLGVLADEPIPVGRCVSLNFLPHGQDFGFDLAGVVVRCLQQAGQYDIGISLRQRLAA